MMKLVLMACALITANHFDFINVASIPHLGQYAKVLLIALILMPWVANQLDS